MDLVINIVSFLNTKNIFTSIISIFTLYYTSFYYVNYYKKMFGFTTETVFSYVGVSKMVFMGITTCVVTKCS